MLLRFLCLIPDQIGRFCIDTKILKSNFRLQKTNLDTLLLLGRSGRRRTQGQKAAIGHKQSLLVFTVQVVFGHLTA